MSYQYRQPIASQEQGPSYATLPNLNKPQTLSFEASSFTPKSNTPEKRSIIMCEETDGSFTMKKESTQ